MSCQTRRAACGRGCHATAAAARAAPTRPAADRASILRHRLVTAQAEHRAQVVGAHLGDPRFAGADDRLGQTYLALDQVVERLLERARADVLVHLHVAGLADAERAISGLV